jgi:hypothetical protein
MGGPIVRTGTTPAFWENWDRVFAGKGKSSAKGAATKKPAKSTKAGKKSAKKKKK